MKNQPYFIVVVAHSLHGRLQRLHIPYTVLYGVLALAVVDLLTVLGMAGSYARLAWKASNYNVLVQEINALRGRYQLLQREANDDKQQLATLQLLATEISTAYGLKRTSAAANDIYAEARLIPTVGESINEFNFLRNTQVASFYRTGFHRLPSFRREFQDHPALWPVEGVILSRFGNRLDPFSGHGAFHSGVDIQAAVGTPVKATGDGVVKFADRYAAYGKLLVVDHGNGMESYYAHLSIYEVMPGQPVKKGDIIARTGATGRVTAPHLHYEVRLHGAATNPYNFLKQTTATYAKGTRREMPF